MSSPRSIMDVGARVTPMPILVADEIVGCGDDPDCRDFAVDHSFAAEVA